MNKKQIISILQNYHAMTLDETPQTAAVLIFLLYDEQDNIFLLLTKRSHTLSYAGDYCFPGGMRESLDTDLKMTAVREVEEELGLNFHYYQIIGQLDDFVDRYGNVVKTFLASINKETFESHCINSSCEIEKLHYFPIQDLYKIEQAPELEQMTKRHPTYCYSQNDVVIWGLTASIMVHLSNILFDLNKPVGKKLETN